VGKHLIEAAIIRKPIPRKAGNRRVPAELSSPEKYGCSFKCLKKCKNSQHNPIGFRDQPVTILAYSVVLVPLSAPFRCRGAVPP